MEEDFFQPFYSRPCRPRTQAGVLSSTSRKNPDRKSSQGSSQGLCLESSVRGPCGLQSNNPSPQRRTRNRVLFSHLCDSKTLGKSLTDLQLMQSEPVKYVQTEVLPDTLSRSVLPGLQNLLPLALKGENEPDGSLFTDQLMGLSKRRHKDDVLDDLLFPSSPLGKVPATSTPKILPTELGWIVKFLRTNSNGSLQDKKDPLVAEILSSPIKKAKLDHPGITVISAPPPDEPGQLVPQPRGVPQSHKLLGPTGSGSICLLGKQENRNIIFHSSRGSGVRHRHLRPPLESQTLLRISSDQVDPTGSSETHPSRFRDDPDYPILAQEAMVCTPSSFGSTTSNDLETRPLNSRSGGPSISQDPKPDGPVSEEQILGSQGFSDRVIQTLTSCRKPVTRKIYAKSWKKFHFWMVENQRHSPDIPTILDFFQEGIDKGLSLGTLKVQAAALSVFLRFSLREDPNVNAFFRAIARTKPTRIKTCPAWDLSLVLQALVTSPFEPLVDLSVKMLTLKTLFLVAITSARRVSELQALSIREPFLMIFDDRIVLKTDPGFLPKRVSSFHRTQDIVLPSFCNFPNNNKEREFSCLDVRRALLRYLEVTKTFRKSDTLFLQFSGSHKGEKASKATLARWIKQAITEAYMVKKVTPPFITAHSTRALSTSWAERAGASPDQICKAATWSNFSTFVRHYRLDLLSSQEQAFGRKVLQAVVPP